MDWRDRLLSLMGKKGFSSRTDLCHKAGISSGSLNTALKGGHDLKLSTMNKLADVLGTTTRWLYYGDDYVEAKLVPLFYTSSAIHQFLTESQTTESSPELIQIGGEVSVTDNTFAIKNDQVDMEPVFAPGDVLVIQPCSILYRDWDKPLFVIAKTLAANNVLRFFVRRLCYQADGLYLHGCSNSAIPPIPANDCTEKSAEVVGIVMQRISTMTFAAPKVL